MPHNLTQVTWVAVTRASSDSCRFCRFCRFCSCKLGPTESNSSVSGAWAWTASLILDSLLRGKPVESASETCPNEPLSLSLHRYHMYYWQMDVSVSYCFTYVQTHNTPSVIGSLQCHFCGIASACIMPLVSSAFAVFVFESCPEVLSVAFASRVDFFAAFKFQASTSLSHADTRNASILQPLTKLWETLWF